MSADPLETLTRALSDRYRVERLLGSGGMATVYLARDLKHDRPVAIKVLRPEVAAALGPERFLREIQIAARLNHPHILALHDSGEADGLLYYVMPHVEGESLQDRIAREKQLPVADAVRIAREVASALAYAHGQGFIHRDIKPGNILLSGGYALVADFGLARALTRAQSDNSITHSGLTIGTPTYMSPEQAGGEGALDGRSDLYALGCVLYEMLVGDPPFTGSTPGAVLARHVAGRVMPIRALRPAVPVGVERAVLRALEKVPADRFQKVEELHQALGASVAVPIGELPKAISRGVFAIAGIVLAIVLLRPLIGNEGTGPEAIDTAKYAVLPFQRTAPSANRIAVEQLIQDALARWSGISVVDGIQVAEAIGRAGSALPLSSPDASRIARQLRAGRFIRGEIADAGDSLRLRIGLYEIGSKGRIREQTARVGADLRGMDSIITRMTDQLLFPVSTRSSRPTGSIGTRVLPALQAFARGDSAILRWDLAGADSALSLALRLDPQYAQAALSLALVRSWSSTPLARWRPAAEQAGARRSQLSPPDRMLADALVAQGRLDYPTACGIWRRLTQSDAGSFTNWFGLASCVRRDIAVIPDAGSPSGWRFRSSYHEAVQAYRRAFELLPSMHVGLRADGYMRLRGDILYTTGRVLRPGRAIPPDTSSFVAYPEWAGDSLVFFPFPSDAIIRGATGRQEQRREGILQQRRIFLQVAQSWTAHYPESADAFEALALALEMLGDVSARDTLRRARLLATSRTEALRVASSEVWVRLKFALPADIRELEAVRALTDTLLDGADSPDAPNPAILSGIAALRGRPALAARLATRSETVSLLQDRPLARDGPALWAYAAAGGPADTLRELERRVEASIEASLTEAERAPARRQWLSRAASLVFPEVVLRGIRLGASGDELLKAQSAAADGRFAEARAAFPRLTQARKDALPERLTYDAVYPEARLLLMLDQPRDAAAWLDPPLSALTRTAPQSLADEFNAAALVRTMALRADLALALGDPAGAARWARPVVILWRDADRFLLPLVQRMARLGN